MTNSAILDPADESALGIATWTGQNPFGEHAAYALLYPESTDVSDHIHEVTRHLGLGRMDMQIDIPRVGSDLLHGVIEGDQLHLRDVNEEWVHHPVSAPWIEHARARGYFVLVMGVDPLDGELGLGEYLARPTRVYTGIVRVP